MPRHAIAAIARWVYNEPYLAVSMGHRSTLTEFDGGAAVYSWSFRGDPFVLTADISGPSRPPGPDSEAAFITEHYWGYTRQRNGDTLVRTESIWMVALAHGALNNWGQYAFKFMGGPGQLGDGLVLGTGGLALLVVGSLLVARGRPSTSPLGAILGRSSVTAAQQACAAGGGRRDD